MIASARADIEATGDLLERALKLSGLITALFAEQDAECVASARQMMAAALKDTNFDWAEAERLAALRDFAVLPQMRALKEEIANA